MLPNIDLDNETFDEIMEAARNTIVSTFPEWTDFNAHDPGITMLETFAWIKESRQYYLNKIGTANILKYLKLLGISRQHKTAARADVTVRCGKNLESLAEDLILPSGAKFYAGGLCFETAERTFVPAAKIICCIARYGEEKRVINSRELDFGGSLGLKPFGINTPENGEFRIGFDKPLPIGENIGLYINVEYDGSTPRNPITNADDLIPLVCMKAEYYGKNGWSEAEIIKDTSFGFITSGKISIVIPDEMRVLTFEETKAFWIRFKITGGEYDTQPIIESIEFNFAELRQRDTKSEIHDFAPSKSYTVTTELAALGNTTVFLCSSDGTFTCVDNYEREMSEDGSVVYSGISTKGGDLVRIVNTSPDFFKKSIIGIGTGLPFQEYDLECPDIEYESFRIMTQIPDSDKKYVEWTKVPDFAGSKPSDLHYVFESDTGMVKFGSCTHGAAPEGMIIIIGYAVTAGSGGNVSANKINRLGTAAADISNIVDVINKRPAYGGSDEESIDDCQKRIHKILNSTETVVTAEDIEKRIMKTEGLRIENCRVIGSSDTKDAKKDTVITVVVQPYSTDGRGVLSERCKENILRQIERFRMLGTRIDVVSPQYTDIGVYADVGISFRSSGARAAIESAVREYFLRIRNSFGTAVSYGELYRIIDSLDCVICVNTLTIDAPSGGAKKNGDGDIILSSGAVAVLTETELVLHTV